MRADYTPEPETINAMFRGLVKRHDARIAIDYRDATITYQSLGQRAAQIANALIARGIGEGKTVALYMPNSAFHPMLFFGALLAGARVTHLSPLDAMAELAFKCRDSEARILFCPAAEPFRDMAIRLLAEGAVQEIVLCDEALAFGAGPSAQEQESSALLPVGAHRLDALLAGVSETMPDVIVAPESIALLQYTGGTTGRAKAAILTHANLTAATRIYGAWFADDAAAGPQAVVLVVLPLFHIMALVSILLRRLNEGACLVLHQRFDVEKTLDDIARKHISGFSGVPTMWIALVNVPDIATRDLSSLASIGSGGAPLPIAIHNRIRALTGLDLRGGWGMTETCAAGTNLPLVLPPGKEGSVGIPLPGISIDIVAVDDATRILPIGETGEIRIRAPNVTAGYWNRTEETAAAFHDGCFLTSDIGRMDQDGFLYLIDRKNDLIISGGFNVYPQTIENAVIEHPAVAEVLVIGVPDSYRGEAAKACVVLRKDCPAFTLAELRYFLHGRLGRHEMPQHLVFRDILPKTPVGKYSRKLLREQEMALDATRSCTNGA